jgi:hypothetical protein
MRVAYRQRDRNRRERFDRRLRVGQKLMIESLLQAVILRLRAVPCHAGRQRRIVENGRQIQAAGLPVMDGGLDV